MLFLTWVYVWLCSAGLCGVVGLYGVSCVVSGWFVVDCASGAGWLCVRLSVAPLGGAGVSSGSFVVLVAWYVWIMGLLRGYSFVGVRTAYHSRVGLCMMGMGVLCVVVGVALHCCGTQVSCALTLQIGPASGALAGVHSDYRARLVGYYMRRITGLLLW